MNEPSNFIEINGRKYDANTGQVIGAPIKVVRPSVGVMDSVMARPGHKKPLAKTINIQESRVSRSENTKHRKPEKSKILMRPAVQKPKIVLAKKDQEEQKRPTLNPVNHQRRLKRAESIPQSTKITKFNQTVNNLIKKTVDHVPVVENSSIQEKLHQEVHIPEPIKQNIDQFEQAVANATSHLEEYIEERSPKRFKKVSFAVVSLSAVLLCGFVAYNAIPLVKVKVAGNKAGFNASLPSYSPAGYGLNNNIDYSSGQVSLAYSSRTDDKGYTINQQPSNWNSETLLNNYVAPISKDFETLDVNGKKVYTYKDSGVTWVDGGVWYNLEGNAALTTDQIKSIVNGL